MSSGFTGLAGFFDERRENDSDLTILAPTPVFLGVATSPFAASSAFACTHTGSVAHKRSATLLRATSDPAGGRQDSLVSVLPLGTIAHMREQRGVSSWRAPRGGGGPSSRSTEGAVRRRTGDAASRGPRAAVAGPGDGSLEDRT